jgi:acyl-CoA thioesterase-2
VVPPDAPAAAPPSGSDPYAADPATANPGILAALDGLLGALDLEPLGDDRFRAGSEPSRFERVYGGQLIAQATQAACATVEGKDPHSFHAYFVTGGLHDQPLEFAVDRVRDGRTMTTRQVTISQAGRTVVVAMVSFHAGAPAVEVGVEVAPPPPPVPPPHELPTLQDWAARTPERMRERARVWIDQPPPLEVRMGEALTFLGGATAEGTRSHWLRIPRSVGDDPRLNAVLFAYASDYFLMDMAMRSNPEHVPGGSTAASTLDHAFWLHRPIRFDRWHLYTQDTLAMVGERGLVRGSVHDPEGVLVASTVQEILVPQAGRAR